MREDFFMNTAFFKSVIKGTVVGIVATAAVALITALALTATSDPLALTKACGIIADFAGGMAAAVAAVSSYRQKALPTSMAAGLMLCLILLIISLISGCIGSVWVCLAAVAAGSFIGSLIPAVPQKGVSRKKLKPYRR